MNKLLPFCLIAMLLPAAAVAAADSSKPVLSASSMDAQAFASQREAIEKDLAEGKTYAEIDPRSRMEVQHALDRIALVLKSRGSVDAMTEDEKARVLNDQDLVNNTLTQAGEDSRLVCTREKKVGSHRTTTNCMTVAERRRAMEQSQNEMQKTFRSPILETR